MAEFVTCRVNQVGPAADGTETPVPVLYINLTQMPQATGTFNGQWFFCHPAAKDQMLAVALSAISLGKQVVASLDPPNAGGSPYTQVYRLYIYVD